MKFFLCLQLLQDCKSIFLNEVHILEGSQAQKSHKSNRLWDIAMENCHLDTLVYYCPPRELSGLLLIYQMVAKISSGTTKKLFQEGKIQIIKILIFGGSSIMGTVICDTKVIKVVQTYYKSYMWSGANIITKKALVLEKDVYTKGY